ncbi:MAG: galactose ABC transporter substrate-binding protein [Erysipelotrichaceae bacterium]|nr:galactose ABC transporter substrate-binding protein [Erysipelotrichaceae bacterium]MDY5251344.1 galactose ABC transporter substrate-binding protein [Erysipelotrichaceae bacterium]
MKKKLLALLTTGALLFGMVGCSSPTESSDGGETTKPTESTTTTSTDKETKRIGVSIYKFDDNFMTLYRNELESYFKELSANGDYNYEVDIQDGKNDMAEQTTQIENFISAGYDALVINLVQSTSASTIIDKCASADIPCIFINREPVQEDMEAYESEDYGTKYTYVGADARQSGKFQGEIIADLPNKGDVNGDGVLSYVMVQGDPENIDAQYRTEFSVSQYKEKSGLEVEQLDMQRGDWDQAKGQEIVANALTKFGDKVEVVFCNNDAMALGAVQAIEAAGRTVGEDIYIVGVDALAEAVELVENGGMTGTVLNDHIGQSHTAADCVVNALSGEALETYYWVDYVKVTAE